MRRELAVLAAAWLGLGSGAASAPTDLLSDPKLGASARSLLQAAGNEEQGVKNFEFISQRELQAALRFMHRDELDTLDVFNLKTGIRALPLYAELSPERQRDLDSVLADIVYVRSRMGEHEAYNSYHCRFALTDDPYDELSANAFAKNPERYRGEVPDESIRGALKARGERGVVGLCWLKKDNDRLQAWTREIRARKPAAAALLEP